MDVAWSLPRRIAFRFGIIAGILFLYPFPIGLIPKTEWLAEYFYQPFVELVLATGRLFGTEVTLVETGSGDKLYDWIWTALVVVLSAIGAAIWSIVDRKRPAYPRLAARAVVVLRYALALEMFSYGFAKLWPSQFVFPNPVRLDMRLGEMSPMGLLWEFMGYSAPYEMFTGSLEVLGGVLLLFRRTATAGSLLISAVLANVVLLNFSYDVPVKLHASELLLIALILFAPQARRMIAALLGHAVPELPPPPELPPKRRRILLGLKLVVIASMAYGIVSNIGFRPYRSTDDLDGTWLVTSWSADGIEHPPLLTDPIRWRRLSFAANFGFSLRVMPDDAQRIRGGYQLFETEHTVHMLEGGHRDVWSYRRDNTQLTIDGPYRGRLIHATLVREPTSLLASRGFHWIQEEPFHP